MKTVEDYQDKAEALRVELAAAKSTIVLQEGIIADLGELVEDTANELAEDMPLFTDKLLDGLLAISWKYSGK